MHLKENIFQPGYSPLWDKDALLSFVSLPVTLEFYIIKAQGLKSGTTRMTS